MITVYLLGHKVGDVEEPVLYVSHKSFDYDGNEVTKGIPDPFIESLVHDSIIVQIPRLRGHVNNRLDEVLSVFDQSYKDKYNHQVLKIDETKYADDEEMQHIIHRLLSAASDAELRHEMNVEDEYFTAIENRDTTIMLRDQKIKDLDAQLAEKEGQLAEIGGQLAEMGGQLAEMGGQLAEKEGQLAEKDGQLAEKDGQLAEKEGLLAEKDGQLAEKDGQLAEKDGQLAEKDGQLAEQRQALLLSAKALKDAGIPLEQISVMTTLPLDAIEKL